MALQARAVVDRKDLGEALDRAGDNAMDKLNKATPPSVGRALSYPARKLYETVTGKKVVMDYCKGGKVISTRTK